MRMRSLQACLLWRLAAALFLSSWAPMTSTVDLCTKTLDDLHHVRADTICASPYCSCNNPYGRIYCSCIPQNATLPQAFDLTVKSSGPCRVPQEAKDLILTDCRNITFPTNGLQDLRNLRTVQVSNTREVIIQKHAFHWNATAAGLVIMFTNTTVADIPSYTFGGHISRVVFRNVYIGLIRSFAFSSLTDTDRIHFDNSNFANIEPQSFKKFSTNEFHIENSRFHIIPSRFLIEIHVHNTFRMNANFIDTARTLSFEVNHAKETVISSNKFNVIEGEAFSMVVHGRVTIQDNVFENIVAGAFRGIKVDPRKVSIVLPELRFENNTIGDFTEASITFNDQQFNVHLAKFLIDDACTCDNLVRWRDICFPPKKNKPGVPIEAHLSEIWCHEESKKEVDLDFIPGQTYYEHHCTQLISSIYFFVIVIVCTAVGLCVLIVVCIVILRRRRQWDAVPTTDVDGVKQKKPKKGLVVPDGRVYRETEFHVIVEKVEPMEEAVPFRMSRDRSRTICNGENVN